MQNFSETFDAYKKLTEDFLKETMSGLESVKSYYEVLPKACSYSLLAGGKRIRPVMLLAACEMAGGNVQDAVPFAAAMLFSPAAATEIKDVCPQWTTTICGAADPQTTKCSVRQLQFLRVTLCWFYRLN